MIPSNLQYKWHNKIDDHSDVAGASPVGAAPTCRRCCNYIFILDLTPGFNGLGKKTIAKGDGGHLIFGIWCRLYLWFDGKFDYLHHPLVCYCVLHKLNQVGQMGSIQAALWRHLSQYVTVDDIKLKNN